MAWFVSVWLWINAQMLKSFCPWRDISAHEQLPLLWRSGTEQTLPCCRYRDRSFFPFEGRNCEQCPSWEGAEGQGSRGIGDKRPHIWDRPAYQGSIYMLTQWESEPPMIRLHKARHTLRVFDLLFIPSLGLHILKSPNFLPQCNLLPQPIPAWSIRFLINTFTLICDSPWIFIPTKLKYLYFKRGFLNGWCLNHGTFRRFGSYTDLLICLLASFSGYRCFVFVYFIILSPSFNKKFLFFPAEKPFPVIW